MSGLEENYPELLASTRRLDAAHPPSWLPEFLKRTGIEGTYRRVRTDSLLNPVFRNGFLHRIAARPSDIAEQWDWLREREPIQGMELLVGEHLPREFHDLSQPTSWRTLKVSPDDWFTANSVGDVLRWGLPDLRELDLSRCSLGVDGCRLLANLETTLPDVFDDWTAPPPLPEEQLVKLVLHACAFGDEGACILFGANTLSALEKLDISQCRLQEAATLEAMRDSAQLAGLRSLSIAGNKDLGGKLDVLAGWSVLPQLERLALPLTATVADLRALFPAPSSRLRALDLSSAKEILKEPEVVTGAAEAFTTLDIGTTRIGDKNWPALLAAPSVKSVVTLRANGCSLSDAAVDQLVQSSLDRLVTLDLSSNKLTDKSLRALAEWTGLRNVTHLRIGNNRKIALPGYQALMDSPHFNPTALDIGKSSNTELIDALQERFADALLVRTS
jgi:hypothetical protein